jgi:uncharacterized protein (DUF58 family)
METVELLKKVRKIEIKTRGLSNQVFTGNYHSAFKGRGMSFSEVREYQYGDDVRSIDWNVTARFSHPYVKVFEEERELTVMLLVDISKSGMFGTIEKTKRDLMAEIAAVLAFSASTNNDKVGVLFFSDCVEKFIPPKKGKSHILRIIRELLEIEPKGKGTDITLALRFFNNMMKKRSIAFLMSDFMAPPFNDALNIAGKKHDIIGLHIHDRRDAAIPDIGLVQVKDAESGKLTWIDTSNKNVRNTYGKWYKEQLDRNKNAFMQSGSEIASISTTDAYWRILMNLFSQRGSKR